MTNQQPLTPPSISAVANRARRTACAASLLLASLGFAAEPNPAAGEEPLLMSPFTVAAGDDVGYQASSTLAGSRLKTPLQDVASQISVFTTELMSDLNLTSLDEVLMYSTNGEGYLDYTPGGDEGTTAGSLNVGNANRIRGLGQLTVLRSFFETSFPIDTYNTDRVTIASGPNALLFGLGNPGGITDASLAAANFLKNRTQLGYRRDNFDAWRSTFDTNLIVVPKRVALRIAALDGNDRTFRKGSRDENRRLYTTVTVKPFENTTLRLNGEWIRREASRAAMVPAHDYATPWADAGRPVFNNAGLTPATSNANFNKALNNSGLSAVLERTGGNFVLPVGNTPAMSLMSFANTASVRGANDIQARVQDRNPELSLIRPDIYDPYGNIYGNANISRERGRILNAFLEQRITKDLAIEAAYMEEENTPRQGSYVDGNNSMDIFLDPNQFLPDGVTPNPNFGKAYSQSAMVGTLGYNERSEERLTVSYDLDLTRRGDWLGWLGRHRIGGMLSNSDFETRGQQYRMLMRGTPSFLPTAAKTNFRTAARIPVFRTYLGDGVNSVSPVFPGNALDFDEPQYITGPGGEQVELAMYHNPDGSYGAANGTVRNVISKALVDQVYLLKDRLIATYGWRESRVRLKNSLDEASYTPYANGLYPLLQDTQFADAWDTSTIGESINWGLVARPISWLSFHYSDSTNFAVQSAAWFDPYGAPIPGANGDGKDYGFSVHLPNNKLSLRVNRYVNTQNNTRPDNTIAALRSIPLGIEQRMIELAPDTPTQGIDLRRFSQANYQTVGSQEAKGYDIEMTVNPNANWRGILNVGQQRTTTQITDVWFRWVEERLPVWQTFGAGWDTETYSIATNTTIHQMYDQWVATQRDPNLAAKGRRVDNQREWRASGMLTYAFTNGRLRGLTLGGGGRWRSGNTLGYALTTLGSGQEVIDLSQPFTGDSEFYADAFISYVLRDVGVRSLRSRWKFQLNVRNLFSERGLIPTNVLSSGQPSVYTYRNPRQFIFSVNVDL